MCHGTSDQWHASHCTLEDSVLRSKQVIRFFHFCFDTRLTTLLYSTLHAYSRVCRPMTDPIRTLDSVQFRLFAPACHAQAPRPPLSLSFSLSLFHFHSRTAAPPHRLTLHPSHQSPSTHCLPRLLRGLDSTLWTTGWLPSQLSAFNTLHPTTLLLVYSTPCTSSLNSKLPFFVFFLFFFFFFFSIPTNTLVGDIPYPQRKRTSAAVLCFFSLGH